MKGSVQSRVKKQFEPFAEEASRWKKLIFDPDEPFECSEEETSDLIDFVFLTLQLNYRIIPEVATHLRLLDVQNLMQCIQAVFHDPKRENIADAAAITADNPIS